MPSSANGLTSNIDMSTVIHAAVIAVILLVLYHLLFQR
jgi:hypothetical protein